MFDFANQPFYTLIMTFVFSVYFTDVFITGEDGAQKLTLTQTISGVAIAILSPVLGSITDIKGNRKLLHGHYINFICHRYGITLVFTSWSPRRHLDCYVWFNFGISYGWFL
jgi:MFS-type transporter involved in bile tolerance (Atg22 family)